jgi:hypothetical protein
MYNLHFREGIILLESEENIGKLSRKTFESREGQEFSLHVVQTGSGVHPTSYPMGTGDSFPRE